MNNAIEAIVEALKFVSSAFGEAECLDMLPPLSRGAVSLVNELHSAKLFDEYFQKLVLESVEEAEKVHNSRKDDWLFQGYDPNNLLLFSKH